MKKFIKILIDSGAIFSLNLNQLVEFIKITHNKYYITVESYHNETYSIRITGIKKKAKPVAGPWPICKEETMGVIDPEASEPNLDMPGDIMDRIALKESKEYIWPHEDTIAFLCLGSVKNAIVRHSKTIGFDYDIAMEELFMWLKGVIDQEAVSMWIMGKKLDAVRLVEKKGINIVEAKYLCEKYCPLLIDSNNREYFYDEMRADEFEKIFSLLEVKQ